MGMTYGPKPRDINQWIREFWYTETEDKYVRLLDTAKVGFSEIYAALEVTDKETSEREVTCEVLRVRYVPRATDGLEFGWNCFNERAGPMERRAPARILDMLTPTDHPSANEWRQDCRDRLERRARNKLKAGELVELDEAMRFTNGQYYSIFRMKAPKQNHFAAVDPDTGQEVADVRISNWRDRDFTKLQGRRLGELKDRWKGNNMAKAKENERGVKMMEALERMFESAPEKGTADPFYGDHTREEMLEEIARLRPLVPAAGYHAEQVTWFELQNQVEELPDERMATYLEMVARALPAEPYLEKMLSIATKAHAGQTDRAGEEYILHPMAVVTIMRQEFPDADDEQLAIALGHDVIEDTDETRESLIEQGMTERVVDGIWGVSKRKGLSMDDYKEQVFENEDRMRAKLCDLEHNSDLNRLPKVSDRDIARSQRYEEFAEEIRERLRALDSKPTP